MTLNPVRFTRSVTDEFRRYQLTAFPIADRRLAEQANRLLGAGAFRESPLTKGPYVSLARALALGATLDELVAEGLVHPALAGIAEFPQLFAHQETTLRAVAAGKHPLVSTGTGSGKTESFLFPIIDHCLRLRDQGADPGLVAVIVYPMNALASDQRDRLRMLLAGTGITYGMYVGSTPATSAEAGVRALAEGEGRDALVEALRRKGANDEDVVPFEECTSRREIRERKPRILITNANQLELLLTRQLDFEHFTNAPLQFIVLDEAHTYSGASGAEVACLVRRLRAFAGREKNEVTCIATSATIVDPEVGANVGPDFLARLCGVDQADVELVQEQYEPLEFPGRRSIPEEPADPYAVLERILEALGAAATETEERDASVDRDALATAVGELTGESLDLQAGDVGELLFAHLEAMEPVRVLLEELEHPRSLEDVTIALRERLGRKVEPPEVSTAEVLSYLALGAFASRGDTPLLRPKLHVFVRGLEGAVVTFDDDPPAPVLHFSAADALRHSGEDRLPTGVFPLSVCRTCGQHYMTTALRGYSVVDGHAVGGTADAESAYWPPSGDSDEEGASRVRFTDWFLAEGDPEETGDADSKTSAKLDGGRDEAWLCRWCGAVHRSDGEACANPICARPGPLARVFLVLEEKGFRCLGCGARGGPRGGQASEPIRPVRASSVADVHILAQEMISAAGSDDERRLLIFADNRQDAAFQAGWMRDHARRYRLRYLLLETLRKLEEAGDAPVSVGDLHADVLRRLRDDRDLARAIAPEAFDTGTDEVFGRLSDTNLARFLRIQILRELATSFAQRDGLERWGQLRVVYAGIEPGTEAVDTLAAELGLNSARLADGIASLLDSWRRSRLLHDEDEPIFSKWWQAGSDEVQRGFIPFGFTEVSPPGIKLQRTGGDADAQVRTVVSDKGRTGAVDFIGKWGVNDPKAAATAIWELLKMLGVVVPVRLVGGNDRPLPGRAGAHQINLGKLGLIHQSRRFVCSVCGRVHARPTPGDVCTKIYCAGLLEESAPPANDYNVSLLSRPFAMVTPEEHTAQVPAVKRDEIEKAFKRPGGSVNTLVATPTLELGVDIGALDLVLLRNVPPTAANYWQRVGRAGRRRRMAVVYVYCRQAIHDAYFFEQPERLLGAPIRPPRFNLKNDVLVRKHAHAAMLSGLLRIAREDPDAQAALDDAFPPYIADYLLEGDEHRYRTVPADVRSPLARLVDEHKVELTHAVTSVFHTAWPADAAEEVTSERLERLVLEMPVGLQGHVDQLHDRLMWVLDTLRELSEAANLRQLTPDELRQRNRADAFLQGLRGREMRTYTLSVLANEGFLPGYGLYDGGISAYPGNRGGTVAFELSRPPSVALREFVPGNMLYANRGRYRTARYHFPLRGQTQRTETYEVDLGSGFVRLSGTPTTGYASGAVTTVPALSIADVDLALLSPIRDEENDRFQVPVSVLGMALRHRRGGVAYRFAERDVHHVLGQGLRLVNVGPADRVREQNVGFPVCIVCGASRSPYASPAEIDNFMEWHGKQCGHRPEWIAFTANVIADALQFQSLDDQADAANLGEALRLGASQVLEMEPDDLQILPVPTSDERFDLFLYDPMPGGSGLLAQIVERWTEIVDVLGKLLTDCPGACEASCYSCLRTGRNVFWHRFLDRHRALELLGDLEAEPVESHVLSPQEDATLTRRVATTNQAEDRLAQLMSRAGLEGFVGQHAIDIGPPYGRTLPDFAYPENQVAVYLDGLSRGIHGNTAREQADAIIRDQLEETGWKVIAIAASHLDDPTLLATGFKRIARALKQPDLAQAVGDDTSWYDDGPEDESAGEALTLLDRAAAKPYVQHVPLYSIRAAAGNYLENETAVEEGWVAAPGKLREGMFAVRIEGRSMEPSIPDGSVALFAASPDGGPIPGSRNGKIVLAQLNGPTDPEGGGSYTVKRYASTKVEGEDNWEHAGIELQSLNSEIPHITIDADDEVRVIAEFVSVLHARGQPPA